MSAVTYNFDFNATQHIWLIELGWQIGRLEMLFKNDNFDGEMNETVKKTEKDIIHRIKSVLDQKTSGEVILEDRYDFQRLSEKLIEDIDQLLQKSVTFFMIGFACCRMSLSYANHSQELIELAKSVIFAIPGQYVQRKRELFTELRNKNLRNTREIADFIYFLEHPGELVSNKLKILFMSSDPTNASRLRLSQEIRDIEEQITRAKMRQNFEFVQKSCVRPEELSYILLEEKPSIVHFSGHGTENGEICMENNIGEMQTVEPDVLAELFRLTSDYVDCVVLNACYSEIQAKEISKYIKYVIGMNNVVNDSTAISFAVGFYRAIASNRSIRDAYNFGCAQIRLLGMQGHLVPILLCQH